MTTPESKESVVGKLGVFAVGGLLLFIAIFITDPIGPSPDTGIIDLGPVGVRWLLGCLGGAMWAGGIWVIIRKKLTKPD